MSASGSTVSNASFAFEQSFAPIDAARAGVADMAKNLGCKVAFPSCRKELFFLGDSLAESLPKEHHRRAVGVARSRESAPGIVNCGPAAGGAFGHLEIPVIERRRIFAASLYAKRVSAYFFNQNDMSIFTFSPDHHAAGADLRLSTELEGFKTVCCLPERHQFRRVGEFTTFVRAQSGSGSAEHA